MSGLTFQETRPSERAEKLILGANSLSIRLYLMKTEIEILNEWLNLFYASPLSIDGEKLLEAKRNLDLSRDDIMNELIKSAQLIEKLTNEKSTLQRTKLPSPLQ